MIDPRVQKDFNRLLGHHFKLRSVQAYLKDSDEQVTVVLDPPVAFHIEGDPGPFHFCDLLEPKKDTKPDTQCLDRVVDDWIDPIYDVVPVDPDDLQIQKYRSFYCYGKSYHITTGEVQEGDVVSVQRMDRSWALYN